MAAVALDLLMQSGKKKPDAAKLVAKKLREYRVKLKGKCGTEDWEKVAGWRDELSKATKEGTTKSQDWTRAGENYIREKGRLARRVSEEGSTLEGEARRQLARIPDIVPPRG